MKKTFKLAAVLLALSAFMMVSCQNAASSGSGGGTTPGGGGSSTPTTAAVDKDPYAQKLVGSYKIDNITSLVLNADGTGSLSYNAPSGSARSILLNDYPLKWAIDTKYKVSMAKEAGSATNGSTSVPFPYLQLTFESDEVKVSTPVIKYRKYTPAVTGGAAESATDDVDLQVTGLLLNLIATDGVNKGKSVFTGNDTTAAKNLVWGSLYSDGKDAKTPGAAKYTVGTGLLGTIVVNGVEAKVGDNGKFVNGSIAPADPTVTMAGLAGNWDLYSGGKAVDVAKGLISDTKADVPGPDPAKYNNKGLKGVSGKAGNIPVFVPTAMAIAADGTADVNVLMYDATAFGADAVVGSTYQFYMADTTNGKFAAVANGSLVLEVTGVAKLDKKDGYATGVIKGCKVEVIGGQFSITKLAKGKVDTDLAKPLKPTVSTDVIPILGSAGTAAAMMTANAPYASIAWSPDGTNYLVDNDVGDHTDKFEIQYRKAE